jgi:hypothetical protein
VPKASRGTGLLRCGAIVQAVRDFLKRILPRRMVNWIRRRLATRRYLKAISYELLARDTRLDDLEAQIAARRDGFYDRLVQDVLERTDLVLQQLDRRIEGVSARHGERLHAVEEELRLLREAVERLSAATEQASAERRAASTG